MGELLAGVDVGTTGVRCMLFDLQGTLVCSAYKEYGSTYLQPGWVEQDYNVMISQTMAVCQQVVDQAGGKSEEIASVGFSSQGLLTIPVDKRGELVRPLISWQDVRSQSDMPDLLRRVSADDYCKITGMPFIANAINAKIYWMRKHEPELYERTDRFVQHQGMILKSFGAEGYFTDLPCMSFYGVWNVHESCWSSQLLDRFEISQEQLDLPTQPGTQVGEIPPSVAEKTGFAVGTPICVGGLDQACSAVGMGSIEPGMAIVNLGTAGTANLVVDKPTVPHSGLLCHHNAVDGLWTLLGGSLSAASCYRWFRDTIGTLESERAEQQGGNAYQALNDLAAQAPAGSQGLIFLPYLNSAGAPHWNSDARAAFIGLSMTHGRAELTRSVMEGVALDMHNIMMSWSRDATVVDKLRLGGGPTNSPLWNQIQADVYGRAVQLLKVEETSVLGAAILGGVGAGVFSSVAEGVDSMVHVMSEIEPDLANHRIYSEMYNAFTQAYEGLDQNTFSILASLQVN